MIENSMVLPTASDNYIKPTYIPTLRQCRCCLCGDTFDRVELNVTSVGLVCDWCIASPDNNFTK